MPISDERRERLVKEKRTKRRRRDALNRRIARIKAFLKANPVSNALRVGDVLVDVSSHQGSVDWQAMKGAGAKGSYNKMTEGRDFVDERGAANLRGSLAAGLRTGAYHFARPDTAGGATDARAECLAFINACREAFPDGVEFIAYRDWIAGKRGILGVLDFEKAPYDPVWAREFGRTFKERVGVRCAVYGYGAPLNAIAGVIKDGVFAFVIVAAYVNDWRPYVNDAVEPHCRMWQYTSSGSLGGENPLDMNRWLG